MNIGICEHCGKNTTYKYKSLVKRYCSRSCANKASADVRTKDKIDLVCEHCGIKFKLLDSVIKSREKQSGTNIKYCSQRCMGLASRTRYIENCKECGIGFETTRNQFCSVQCVRDYKKRTGMMKKEGCWHENGYKVLYLDGDKSIKEHIKIMEEYIGRKLKEDEVVHHINGVRDDNRLENLKLMTRGEHSSLHRKIEIQEGKELFTPSF